MKKTIDYSFSNLGIGIARQLLQERGINGQPLMLPFFGDDEHIKTAYFQSKTAEKAFVCTPNGFYLLKKVPWYCADSDFLDFLYTHYNELVSSGFPCPAIVKTLDGNSFSSIGSDFYVCFENIDGTSYQQITEQARAVGQQLAKLHLASLGSPVQPQFRETIAESFDQLADISLLPNIAAIKSFVHQTFSTIKDYDRFSCIVHGDYNPSNIIFDSHDNVKVVVDFDNTKYDNPARDLAEALLTFGVVSYRDNTSNFENIWNEPNTAICSALLEGYREALARPELYDSLLTMLPATMKIIACELYVLSFLKKNDLLQPGFLGNSFEFKLPEFGQI